MDKIEEDGKVIAEIATSEEEAFWIRVRDEAENSLKQARDMQKFHEKVVELAEEQILDEQNRQNNTSG